MLLAYRAAFAAAAEEEPLTSLLGVAGRGVALLAEEHLGPVARTGASLVAWSLLPAAPGQAARAPPRRDFENAPRVASTTRRVRPRPSRGPVARRGAHRPPTAGAPGPPAPSRRSWRIRVADDEPGIGALADLLASEGNAIRTADHGASAPRAVKAEPPEVAVLDRRRAVRDE